MATDVAYEDLQLFPQALNGHAGVRELFADWGDLEPDVLFVVDDVTQHGADAAGVLWHLEARVTALQCVWTMERQKGMVVCGRGRVVLDGVCGRGRAVL